MSIINKLNKALSEIEKMQDNCKGFDWYGVRCARNENSLKFGDSVGNSYVWDDGEPTNEELDGTSAIDVRGKTAEQLLRMLDMYNYGEGQLIMIGGHYKRYGEDEEEIIIQDAVVTHIF